MGQKVNYLQFFSDFCERVNVVTICVVRVIQPERTTDSYGYGELNYHSTLLFEVDSLHMLY